MDDSNDIGKLKIRTKIVDEAVDPEDIDQQELVFGNYEKCMYVKDYDGLVHKFAGINDVGGQESIYKTWSSKKIKEVIDILEIAAIDHNHDSRYYRFTQVDSLLNEKSDTTHDHNGYYYLKSETFNQSDINNLLADKAQLNHNHDDEYYIKATVDTMVNIKMNLVTGVENNIPLIGADGNLTDSGFTPASFAPSNIHLTSINGYDATEYVHTEGDETIDGVKTHVVIPIIPTTAPTVGGQVVSKQHLTESLEVLDGGVF